MNKTYTPILKCKDAEINTIYNLPVEKLEMVMPLMEIIPKERAIRNDQGKIIGYEKISQETTLTQDLIKLGKIIGDTNIFVDTKLLDEIPRIKSLTQVISFSSLYNAHFCPVIYISDVNNMTTELKKILKIHTWCLRLTRDDFSLFPDNLIKISIDNSYDKSKVHLLIDYGYIKNESEIPRLDYKMIDKLLDGWASITISSGAFPEDLTKFSQTKIEEQTRLDWNLYSKISKEISQSINYGDYTVRNPVFRVIHNPSTTFSIRYTGNKSWYIYRGFSKKSSNYKGYVQYRAHAMNLVNSSVFSGEKYSPGDKYIMSKATLFDENTGEQITTECGNPTTWIQATMSHHICKVIDQLSAPNQNAS